MTADSSSVGRTQVLSIAAGGRQFCSYWPRNCRGAGWLQVITDFDEQLPAEFAMLRRLAAGQ
jgi:hypothetical protein